MNATIYTFSNADYFPGLRALLNSLKYYGMPQPVVVTDMGLTDAQRKWVEPRAEVVQAWFPPEGHDGDLYYWAYQGKIESLRKHYRGGDIIFLDCDLILCDNVEDVMPGALDTADIVTVADTFLNTWGPVQQELVPGLPSSCLAFNAGQWAMSERIASDFLEQWCRLQQLLLDKMRDLIRYGPDQDAYNMLLYTYDHPTVRHVASPPRWYQHLMEPELGRPGKAVVELRDGKYCVRYPDYDCLARMVHFAGGEKPWTDKKTYHPRAHVAMFEHMLNLE